jgi:hypothetical protein
MHKNMSHYGVHVIGIEHLESLVTVFNTWAVILRGGYHLSLPVATPPRVWTVSSAVYVNK